MASPLLNVDVLAVACEFLTDVSDVLALALTSSSLHPVALRWLLRMRPVYLNSGPSIRRFHVFLFADESTRAPHIRALHIDLRQPTPAQNQDEDCSLLVHILASCKHLEHLTIAFHQFTLPIVTEPSFLHTVNAISSLQSLSVRSTSYDGISLLPSFRIPLRSLSIDANNVTYSPRYLKEFLPHAVVPTLETFELDRFAVDSPDTQVIGNHLMPLTFTMAPYTAVRSLSVANFRGRPLLDHLQHLFPALEGTLDIGWLNFWTFENRHDDIRTTNQRIQDGDGGRAWRKLDRVVCEAPAFYVLALRSLDGTLSLGALDAWCKMGTYDHMRAVNQRAQEPNGDGSPARPSRPWTRLDRVICSGQMPYVLGLRCPIRLAMVDFNGISNYARYAAVALRENPVPRLKLTLGHDVASGALDEVFSPELARTLTHLTLCLLYSDSEFDREKDEDAASDPRDRWENVLDGLVSAIRPLRNLTHLRVVLGVTGYVDEDTLPSDEYAYSFRASTFDFEGTAAALSRGLPSLENVFIITTTGLFSIWEWQWLDVAIGGRFKPCERWYASRGWRVAMPGTEGVPEGEKGKGIIVELHEDVVETIVRKEEIVLSERDEKRLNLNHGWHRSQPPLLPV